MNKVVILSILENYRISFICLSLSRGSFFHINSGIYSDIHFLGKSANPTI